MNTEETSKIQAYKSCGNGDVLIKRLAVTDSTNSYARLHSHTLWSEAGSAECIVVCTDEQTAGRGQRGNIWHSCAGENLLASIVVRPRNLAVVSQFALSRVAALAVRAVAAFFGVDTIIKWPNDIYVAGRKLAGILVEVDCFGSRVEQAVVGVGINVNQECFPAMDKIPVSIKNITGESFLLDDVLAALVDAFSYYYSLLQRGDYSALATDYKKHLLGYGCVMRYRDAVSEFDAVIEEVGDDGVLFLRVVQGDLRRYYFKEVELLL